MSRKVYRNGRRLRATYVWVKRMDSKLPAGFHPQSLAWLPQTFWWGEVLEAVEA